MKVLFLALALFCAHSPAHAEDLAEPSSKASEELPTIEPALEAPAGPSLDSSPIPAVAVSIATVALEGPALGSLDFEMSTVNLLNDAPVVPEHENVAKR
jgi:hypothetical protein